MSGCPVFPTNKLLCLPRYPLRGAFKLRDNSIALLLELLVKTIDMYGNSN